MEQQNPFIYLQDVSTEELNNLNQLTATLNENQLRDFVQIYSGRRKKSQDILIFTLLGFLGIAGVQRFLLGQIAMGVVYFLTCGFCMIGTIIDLVNHKSLTDDYNRQMALETVSIVNR